MADLSRITEDSLEPVYIISSTEPLLIERAVAAIRDAAVPESVRGFNYDVMAGKGATAGQILSAARTVPMMASRRLVLVRDLHAVAAAELALLVPYLESPSPTTVLLGVAEKIDKRLKFFATANKKGVLHELAAPRKPDAWVAAEARALGVSATPAALRRLVDVVGADLSRLSLALEQLALYAGERSVEAEDVDDLIAETRERTVFELTDAIGQGDTERALAALGALFDQRQSPIGVTVMLARHMRQLGLCHVGMAERRSKGEMAKLVGAPPFVVDKLVAQARRYRPSAIARALGELSVADRALKGQAQMMKTLGRGLGERVVLHRLVEDLIALGNPQRLSGWRGR